MIQRLLGSIRSFFRFSAFESTMTMQTNSTTVTQPVTIPQRVPVILFAVTVAILITNLFGPQTLVGLMASHFGLSTAASGTMAMISTIGYSVGLFFIVPLARPVRKPSPNNLYAHVRKPVRYGCDSGPKCLRVVSSTLCPWSILHGHSNLDADGCRHD